MTFENAYEKLVKFRVRTFADRCLEISQDPHFDDMTFLEKVAECADAEDFARQNRRIAKLNKEACFVNSMACIEDIIYMPNRSLRKDEIARYSDCDYIRKGLNIIVTSATGAGKSYLVQALGNAACRHGHSVRYIRHADLCRKMNIARVSGELYELMDSFEQTDLLILDDFFLEDSSSENVCELLEIITHRFDAGKSIIAASQLEPAEWHNRINGKIIADSLLDRIVHNSYDILITGPNMREHCSAIQR